MALASKDSIGGGKGAPYFQPKDHLSDLALLIEPLSFRYDVPNENGPRSEVVAQVTVFRSQAQLDKGEPHEVKTWTFTQKVICRDLIALAVEAKKNGDDSPGLIATLGIWKVPNSTSKAYVLKTPQDEDYEKAEAFYAQREAALLAALDSVPDF